MEQTKDNTEEKILVAATDVFVLKGMDGARMQEIADKAGINKALLHYYFRSKEKLFDAIFSRLIGIAFPRLGEVLLSDKPMLEKLSQAIDIYLDLLLKHPFLPAFIIKEMNRDASVIFKFIEKQKFSLEPIRQVFRDAMDRGEIRKMAPEHLIINLVGLCVFPFAARPMIKHVAFADSERATKQFLKERKNEIKSFVFNSLKPE